MLLDREFPGVPASLSSLREVIREWVSQAGGSPALGSSVTQAVHEAAVNCVVHGYAGGDADRTIAVTGRNGDGWLRLTVADHGRGFRPRRTTPGYGLGLAIVAQLADELEVRDAAGGGLVVSIAFRLA